MRDELKDFLASKYDPDKFIQFISNRFYGFEPYSIGHTDEDLNESEKQHIKSYRYFGKVELDDGKELGFFEFLSKNSNIENKRVGYNTVLKKLADEYDLDGAIASFYHPNSDVWRLSFIGFEFDEGKVNVTNLKRYTYVLGKDIPIKTAYMQLKKLNYPNFEEIKEIFSIEAVTKEFYTGLEKLYFELLQNFLSYPDDDKNKQKEFGIRLIGRIIFSKFLEKKGLITKDVFKVQKDYYFNILEPLFFEKLNKPNQDRFEKFKDNLVPFLNGGLFEPINDIDYYIFDEILQERLPFMSVSGKTLNIDDEFFKRLYEHFDKFNFTIDENTPDDNELSIDPEMLGRIFENFIAEINPETSTNARKATGSYYTPREIVDYMVNQSLLEYLKENTSIDEDILKSVIYEDEIDLEYQQKSEILSALFKIKVLDPACGSGAFPMGMLQKIVRILNQIDENSEIWFKLQDKKFQEKYKDKDKNYFRKLSIINNSIFGVDIQPVAIEIAKLRFFLSLVVDEEIDDKKENRGIEPLPNLEFKFVCANSLIPLEKNSVLASQKYYEYENKLKELKNKYFLSYGEEKEKIKKEYLEIRDKLFKEIEKIDLGDALTSMLANYNPFNPLSVADFFDSEFMFNVKNGFDIVIGNPPYIDSEAMKKNTPLLREGIKKIYKYTKGNWDVYIAFIELGYNLLNKNGNLIYITPDKWLSKPFGKELRKNIYKNIKLILNSGRKVFESAKVDSVVTQITKRMYKELSVFSFTGKKIIFERSIDKSIIKNDYRLDFLFSKYIDILLKIEKHSFKIKNYWECENACATSDAYKLKELIDDNCKFNENKYLIVINTGIISKYINLWGIKEMTYLKDKYLCPIVSIDKFKSNFNKSYTNRAFSKKIIIKGLTLLDCCIDFKGNIIPGKSTLIIKENDENNLKFLSALINSQLYIFYIREKYSGSSYNQGINFTKDMINEMPILDIKNINTKPFKILVDYIIFIKQQNNNILDNYPNDYIADKFQELLDAMVYELYFEKELHSKNYYFIDFVSKNFKELQKDKEKEIIENSLNYLVDTKSELKNKLGFLAMDFKDLILPIKGSY